MASLELGLDTFGDATVDADGRPLTHPAVIRNLVEQAVLADRLGLDFFGVGEHHREDFAVSAPEVVLAAIAGRTERIRLGSAVTVLSSDDPVRVFQRFATLDAVSDGRAEVILGRGSFTESFPLFGYELRGLRDPLRGEARPVLAAAARGAGHLVGRDPVVVDEPARLPRHRRTGSAPGSASAAAPSRSSGPRATACRSCWRSSAATRCASPPSPTSTGGPCASWGSPSCPSASTAPATWPTPTPRRATSTGSTTARCTGASGPSGAGRR